MKNYSEIRDEVEKIINHITSMAYHSDDYVYTTATGHIALFDSSHNHLTNTSFLEVDEISEDLGFIYIYEEDETEILELGNNKFLYLTSVKDAVKGQLVLYTNLLKQLED